MNPGQTQGLARRVRACLILEYDQELRQEHRLDLERRKNWKDMVRKAKEGVQHALLRPKGRAADMYPTALRANPPPCLEEFAVLL